MEVDNLPPVEEETDEARRGRRRQLVQQAISLAMQSRWEEAADVNRQIVDIATDDAEAYNRLGKAYTELGRITEAREAYQSALRADPANLIAQRNMERLSRISDAEAAELAKKAGDKLDPRFFMEETGKTRVTVLADPTREDLLATLAAGDRVQLAQEDGRVQVTTMDGTYIGALDEQLAARLTRLMQSGNNYQAGIVGVDKRDVRVIIRETYQSPENVGRISFPPHTSQDALPRPYFREGLVRRAADESDEDELDIDADTDSEDDEEDVQDFGFHEGGLDES